VVPLCRHDSDRCPKGRHTQRKGITVKKTLPISKRLLAALAVVPLVAAMTACAGGAGGDDEVVKIGVVGAGDPYWADYKQEAKDAGINVDIIDFSDYTQPNPALAEGEIDLNQFQHIVYLADYNVSAGKDLVPIGATAIYPLAVYSKKYTSVDDIKKGETVAVPNDPSNLARSLLVLQSAKLISLKGGGSIFSTLADIDEGASKVKVKAMEASLTPTSLPDVAAAVINNDFVEKAGLKFSDAIAKDDPSDPNAIPYVNIFAARAEDKDNPTYKKLVEIYQNSAKVQQGVKDISGGTAVLLKTPVADLQASLEKVEKETAAHGK
jgi:D-methionine transport system substrate-binding protein